MKTGKKKIIGTEKTPRLCVFWSNQHIYAQIIDDENNHTIAACSTLDPEVREKISSGQSCLASELVGIILAERLRKKNITKVVFDRNNKPYHGRIKSLADGARKGGLVF